MKGCWCHPAPSPHLSTRLNLLVWCRKRGVSTAKFNSLETHSLPGHVSPPAFVSCPCCCGSCPCCCGPCPGLGPGAMHVWFLTWRPEAAEKRPTAPWGLQLPSVLKHRGRDYPPLFWTRALAWCGTATLQMSSVGHCGRVGRVRVQDGLDGLEADVGTLGCGSVRRNAGHCRSTKAVGCTDAGEGGVEKRLVGHGES